MIRNYSIEELSQLEQFALVSEDIEAPESMKLFWNSLSDLCKIGYVIAVRIKRGVYSVDDKISTAEKLAEEFNMTVYPFYKSIKFWKKVGILDPEKWEGTRVIRKPTDNEILRYMVSYTNNTSFFIYRILRRIELGEYKYNDQLPTQHELAKKFSISKNSIQKGRGILIKSGYVEIEKGHMIVKYRKR